MALAELKFFSETLGVQSSIYAVIPQSSNTGEIGIGKASAQQYKCMLLLHGLSDDNSIWLRRTSIERYAAQYNMAVIMPSADKSFYTDMKYGSAYYTYIAKEVPRIASEFFKLSNRREDWFVAGLSMGGYGALKIGLRECDRFCAAASLSGVVDIKAFASSDRRDVFIPIFGKEINIPDDDDLFYLTKKNEDNPERPRIYMGVGTEDYLYADNRKMKSHLENLNYDFVYRESPGVHCWEFWDEYIQYALKWFCEQN